MDGNLLHWPTQILFQRSQQNFEPCGWKTTKNYNVAIFPSIGCAHIKKWKIPILSRCKKWNICGLLWGKECLLFPSSMSPPCHYHLCPHSLHYNCWMLYPEGSDYSFVHCFSCHLKTSRISLALYSLKIFWKETSTMLEQLQKPLSNRVQNKSNHEQRTCENILLFAMFE